MTMARAGDITNPVTSPRRTGSSRVQSKGARQTGTARSGGTNKSITISGALEYDLIPGI
jgi:hypothetical protein